MSKLYEKYLELKNENKEKVYLFKSGNFYIFLDDDASLMSKELGLKEVKFSNTTNKCGFPLTELGKYLKFIKLLKIEYSIILNVEDQIIDLIKNNEIEKIKEQLKKLKKELNEKN